MNNEENITEISTLKREFGSWECLIEDRIRKKIVFRAKKKSLKLAFLQNQLKKFWKQKKEVVYYRKRLQPMGSPDNKTWDIKEANKK